MNTHPSALTRAAIRVFSSTRPGLSKAGALLLALCMAATANAAPPPPTSTGPSLLSLSAGLAQAFKKESDEVAAARAKAKAIIREAEEEASRIRSEALKKAAQIEADALRKAAEIEAAAIRKAAGAGDVGPRPPKWPVGQDRPAAALRERYQNLTGIWSWKGNARNRKFELKQEDDGSVATELFVSPRARFYREDLRYSDGVLSGRTFLTLKTQTGNDEKRFRDFQLTISEDGTSLVGTIIETADKNNRKKRLDIVWDRIRD